MFMVIKRCLSIHPYFYSFKCILDTDLDISTICTCIGRVCFLPDKSNWFAINQFLHVIVVQIPGMKGMSNTTATMLAHLKGFGQKLANSVLVDEEHFPKHSQRFTAVYSRDKEYL